MSDSATRIFIFFRCELGSSALPAGYNHVIAKEISASGQSLHGVAFVTLPGESESADG